jgi:MFS transporter, DHA1 family, multidrug resistance protein
VVRPIEGQPNARELDAATHTNAGAFAGGVGVPMFLALVLLSATAPLATDLYLPGLPTVADSLHTTNVATQLTLTTFMFGMGVGQLLTGALSDGWGRRRLLIGGTIAFVVASVLCALAPSIAVLIAARLMQGFAGGMGIVLSRAVISDRARGDSAARLFSLMMLVGATAPVVAPLLGGVLLGPIGWRGIFWVLAGIGGAMLVGVLTMIPETLPVEKRHGISLTRLATNFGKVLRNRRFVAYTATLALAFGVMFSYISASPFVVQEIFGFSASQFSMVFAVNSVGLVLASAINTRLIGRVHVRTLLGFGLVLISSSSVVLLVLALTTPTSTWVFLPFLFITVLGMGFTMGNSVALAIDQAHEVAGTGSALIGASQFTLAAIVSPLVGIGGEGTSVPMALTMTICAALAAAAFLRSR